MTQCKHEFEFTDQGSQILRRGHDNASPCFTQCIFRLNIHWLKYIHVLGMNARKKVGARTIKFWSCTSTVFSRLNDPLCEELEMEKIRELS